MLRCNVVVIFVVGFAATVTAMPQERNNQEQPTGFLGLPFIQLTDGGIRFNFAGYHAEAGLGGLLGGSRTGGGLHASAGTPWGAHAAAGLGGVLGGDDATAGGGLYARAGLGNGRPEAAAGLGGMLDGSGRSNVPASGGLYAGATMGRRDNGADGGAGADASAGASAGSSAGFSGGAPPPPPPPAPPSGFSVGSKGGSGRTNIQIVSKGKTVEKEKQVAVAQTESAFGVPNQGAAAHGGVRREIEGVPPPPSAEAGLFGAIYVGANGGAPVSKSVEKVKVLNGPIEAAPPAPPLPRVPLYVANTNDVEGNRVNQVVYPRWYLRKRFWASKPRKQVIVGPIVDVDVEPGAVASASGRRVSRQSGNPPVVPASTESVPVPPEGSDVNGGFIEDVFNIPISSITAVSRMLQNNAG